MTIPHSPFTIHSVRVTSHESRVTAPIKVLFCVSEAVPLAKTGGLADVGGALPAALAELGCDIRLALPRYRSIPLHNWHVAGPVEVPVGREIARGTVYEGRPPGTGLQTWLIDQPKWFDREGLYGEGGRDYPDNLSRFTFFCRAVLAWMKQQPWRPDLVHCNDWQTALIPAISKTENQQQSVPTLLTIHNLAYQGVFPGDQFSLTGLPPSLFTPNGLEFWGRVNLLKGGIVFADVLNTVSKTYASEIQTAEFGYGLEGVLGNRQSDLYGILNGADYRVWDPTTDPLIPANYSVHDLSNKSICKAHLRRELGLAQEPDAPLIGMVTRLVDQKGIDLVDEVIADLFAMGGQLVLLGTGDPAYHTRFEEIARRYPRRAGVRIGFDNALAHRIEAGADIFLMPSRYEPSGLNQLYSLRYGTVPVVRRTGGLADSITDVTPETLANGTANGFVFREYSASALREVLRRALATFRDHETWRRLQVTGIKADFSWAASAAQYRALYEQAVSGRARRASAG